MVSVRIAVGAGISAVVSFFLDLFFFTLVFEHNVLLRPMLDFGPLFFLSDPQPWYTFQSFDFAEISLPIQGGCYKA